MADRNQETRQLRSRMTELVSKSTLGSDQALRARETTSRAIRDDIVKASGTLRDPRR